jgi:AcrR family transcriptional regulator
VAKNEAEEERGQRLPPGPHGLSPDLVERNQRERLIAAMAEECAERGYAETSVAEIARRAGVSTASFYRQFKGRRECMLASFEELFGRLAEAIEGACGGTDSEEEEAVGAGLQTAAALLAGDLPTARLLAVEIVAVGRDGVRLQQEAIERLAALLRRARDSDDGSPLSIPGPEWNAIAAMVALVAGRVVKGEGPNVAELEAPLG